MLASSFEKYIHRYGVIPEKNPVIFTNNSSTISLVKSLINLNCKPAAYVDSRAIKNIEREIKNYIKLFKKASSFTDISINKDTLSMEVKPNDIKDSETGTNERNQWYSCLSN